MNKFNKDFEEWVIKNGITHLDKNIEDYPIEMQFGVYQMFADSKNIFIDIEYNYINRKFMFNLYFEDIKEMLPSTVTYTRPEAMQEAVKQFKIYYNEN